ncbi:hypothetical protein VE03_06002 [Pseudogymnoascus sp. 23342-1-I1]|nr:hypothetical protein VE03_06002 [Pseudogymnoascus sp. 23342-1-I1]
MDERRRMSLGHLKNLLTRQASSQSPEPPPCPPKHSLDTLPTEILIQVYTNLELIDATCLSLASGGEVELVYDLLLGVLGLLLEKWARLLVLACYSRLSVTATGPPGHGTKGGRASVYDVV